MPLFIKRLVILPLAAAMCFAVVGCGSSEPEEVVEGDELDNYLEANPEILEEEEREAEIFREAEREDEMGPRQ